jgi:hypothetical protein
MNINGDSRVADGGRKLGKRPADPYLRKYLGDVRIQTEDRKPRHAGRLLILPPEFCARAQGLCRSASVTPTRPAARTYLD